MLFCVAVRVPAGVVLKVNAGDLRVSVYASVYKCSVCIVLYITLHTCLCLAV